MNIFRQRVSRLNNRMRRHGSSGQALAELAIALPVLLLMLVGIFEFARAYQIQQVVVNAAREGARQAVLQGVDADSATIIVNTYLTSGAINTGTATVVVTDTNNTGDPTTVQVSVPYRFALIGPLIRLATSGSGPPGPGDINLTSQATMRHE
ncbi:MAG: pilus assembly protein [Gemmatimonadetes bacterium]|nr:MAG: pilus assembly protein [Gemmatimonadota bacterium]